MDPHSQIMDTASDAISRAGLVYLACPPAARKAYALEAAAAGKALFLEKPFGINNGDSARLMTQLKAITSLSLSTSIKRLALTWRICWLQMNAGVWAHLLKLILLSSMKNGHANGKEMPIGCGFGLKAT